MYETFYHLSEKPFQLSPNPRFFYQSRGHARAMAYLRYGLTQKEGFIVVTGDAGTGKTTLVRAIFAELPEERVVAAQIVSTQLEPEDLLRMIAASFGLPHEGISKAALLTGIEAFLSATQRAGKRVLLVVDEAQNLPARALKELRMLTNLQSGERALLQIFLLGQEDFQRTLQCVEMNQLRQWVIAATHLQPLADNETQAYIEHRLSQAGWRANPTISADAYALIHHYSGGFPRRINTLCDRVLLFSALERRHDIDAYSVQQVADELIDEGTQPEHATAAGVAEASGNNYVDELSQRLNAMEEKITVLAHEMRKDRIRLLEAVLARSPRPLPEQPGIAPTFPSPDVIE